MGLDQYVYKIKRKNANRLVELLNTPSVKIDNNKDVQEELNAYLNSCKELFYWRKHWALQTYMQYKVYGEKAIKYSEYGDYNCVAVRLNSIDINNLKKFLKRGADETYDNDWLSRSRKELIKRDLEFIKEAEKAIDDGYGLIYQADW